MPNDQFIPKIFDFNEQVIGLTGLSLNPLTNKQREWLNDFVQEELTEFGQAFAKQDIVGMVDATIDLCYGAMGTLVKLGLTREQAVLCFDAVHDANMTKKKGRTHRGSDEDAAKPADFVPPEERIGFILFGPHTDPTPNI
jgi:hypothetical protein